ncbi:trypsin-like peptidase domain-containing protein [uncultured Clostridium sp.]|uniref:S1C family serine protease n=1 Tax=uncultured Clostridium sp. TaxID=59620 RepID=UPI0025ED3164|nr:trypsin-like peptidase domain-containing protein [uncultured Clostridium sp.]
MYNDGQNNGSNENYNGNNSTNNTYDGGYNNGNFTYVNENVSSTTKVKRPMGKRTRIAAAVAGVLVLTLGSGLFGGYVTYNLMKKNNQTVVESKSYVAPEFTSSTEGSLTASEAFEKVKPAVVTISTKSIQDYGGFYPQEVEGLGSGFIINEEGYILTNYHVIANSTDVKVLLSTGEEVGAKVVNYDQQMDMAMLKLDEGTKIPGIAELGDSDALYPGQDVIAIGTPLSKNFAQTMTKGIVSAVNREVESESGTSSKVIQTDAAINAGNSGGPLVNSQGQVIGINSMKIGSSGSGSSASVEGMGFAIPINEAKDRIDNLSKPILNLGVKVMQIDEEKAKKYQLEEGLYVKEVTDFSPASKGGVKQGDVIVKFEGTRIKTYDELSKLKAEKNVGDKVTITVNRNGKEINLELELAES